MSKIEEVKAKIREGNIESAMAMAMAEAMKIEIVTTVNDENNSSDTYSCHSFIDLLQNEIEHRIHENNTHPHLENIHFQEVEKAHDKILQNIQSLQKMFTLIQQNLEDLT